MKFEYLLIKVNINAIGGRFQGDVFTEDATIADKLKGLSPTAALNYLGSQDWELVAAVPASGNGGSQFLHFKKAFD